jgi:hypothetical protein
VKFVDPMTIVGVEAADLTFEAERDEAEAAVGANIAPSVVTAAMDISVLKRDMEASLLGSSLDLSGRRAQSVATLSMD